MKIAPLIAATLLAASTGLASAQTMKPGLWEMTNQMQGNSESANAMAKMQKEMASMPPDQAKMMRDMLAKQGVQVGSTPSGAMAIKVCMTQEMIDRNAVAEQRGDCTHTTSPRMGNTMKFSFVCTKPPSSGEGQVTYTSPEAYSTKMTITRTIKGKPERMDMQSSGRWLGTDCGSVKPLALPKK